MTTGSLIELSQQDRQHLITAYELLDDVSVDVYNDINKRNAVQFTKVLLTMLIAGESN